MYSNIYPKEGLPPKAGGDPKDDVFPNAGAGFCCARLPKPTVG